MSTEAARTARELQMLEGMVDCAFALGTAFGEAAKGEAGAEPSLERLDAFQKCFLSVRMGIRLCMSLRAGRAAAPAGRPAAIERPEGPERERPEREAPERGDPPERERDRDYEPVSLPRFLATLGVVARDAGRFDGRLPADAKRALPVLQALLAEAEKAPPAAGTAPEAARTPVAGVAVLARPLQGGRRDKLLGSTSGALPGLGPPGPRPWSGFG